ncbi:MAG: c-type cytochrome [Lewinella sp.]|nr:c-type cytochrome [Lewinella sp.]
MVLRYALPTLILLSLFLSSCVEDELDIRNEYYFQEEKVVLDAHLTLPETPLNYDIELPEHIFRSGLFARPMNRDLATLGRVLFYDHQLSQGAEVACASCHRQELAFSDDKALSDGVNGQKSQRNAIALGSVVSFSSYYGVNSFGSAAIRFFWDERAGTAIEQSHMTLTNAAEMGLTMDEVVNVVRSQPYYAPLFRRAFGDNGVNQDRILAALAEFIDGMGSFESRFDEAAAKSTDGLDMSVPFVGFTAAENHGKALYLTHCANCHSSNFGRPVKTAANNGLDVAYADQGIGALTQHSQEMGVFKVPTLRNIALTAPYMHDGRFATLEEVIEHYNSGLRDHPNLDPELRDANTGAPIQLQLSAQDKTDLIAFLQTLTDNHYVTAEKYSDPFK